MMNSNSLCLCVFSHLFLTFFRVIVKNVFLVFFIILLNGVFWVLCCDKKIILSSAALEVFEFEALS